MTTESSAVNETDESAYLERHVDPDALLTKKSPFVFGPRQTGKTSWIRHALPKARVYDLLDSSSHLALSQHPGRLAAELTEHRDVVVIDEIQRIADLPNDVQRLIETRRLRFLLTGSSARKLPRRGVNLLGSPLAPCDRRGENDPTLHLRLARDA
jgi:predicted AAA+ superfamily ATPase